MNAVVIPAATWIDILNELAGVGNLLDGALLRLFKNNYSPIPGTNLAALTECDFTGYAASSAVVWNPAGYDASGTAILTGDAKLFTVGGPTPTLNTVYGWYLTNAAGPPPTALFFARRFDSPIVLTQENQFIEVIPCYPAYISQ